MEISVSILEIIIAIGVLGNFALQSYWFYSTTIKGKSETEPKDVIHIKDTRPYSDEEANQSVHSLPKGFIKPKDGL